MTDKDLWRRMENMATSERSLEREMSFHKTFVVATIITTPADSLQPHYQKKRFSTFNSDLNRFADWLARMILTAIYSMFCTGEVWNPVDLYKIDMPDHLKEQQLAKAIKQATRFLEKQGLSVA